MNEDNNTNQSTKTQTESEAMTEGTSKPTAQTTEKSPIFKNPIIIVIAGIIIAAIILTCVLLGGKNDSTSNDQNDTNQNNALTYSSGLEYTSNGDGTCYVSGIGKCGGYIINIPPTSDKGERVIGIGKDAFVDCHQITNVSIPESVSDISSSAFYNCSKLSDISVDENNAYYKSIDGNLYPLGQRKSHLSR